MSTITVVRKNGAIAIAADTLTSFGPRKLSAEYNRQPSKIFRLGASFVGLAGDARAIAVAGVGAAIDFDESTGGPVESHVIPLAVERAAEEGELLLKV